MQKLSFLIFIFLSSQALFCQSYYAIEGLVLDKEKGLPSANVLLLKPSDSTLVKGVMTDANGSYKFTQIPKGKYLLMVSMVSFDSQYSEPFDVNSNYTAKIITLSSEVELKEVVVRATKQLYTQKVDRIVINVENSIISAGGSALDILERSPGITVNKQNNSISVVGKNGVVVMIDGRKNYVPESGLVQFLEGISADNIKSMEIITTPPSDFDAEGNAGFINIVLKKSTDTGLNGNYSIAAGYGKRPSGTDNISFNFRKDKINVFGSYSYLFDQHTELIYNNRSYTKDNDTLGTTVTSNRFPTRQNHNARIGLDYQLSEKTVTGILLNGYNTKWTMDAYNHSFDTTNGLPTAYTETLNEELNQWKHFGANYNLKHNFADDHYLSFNIDYLHYKDNNPNTYENSYFDENKVFLYIEKVRSGKVTPITTWVSSLDYSNKFNKKIKFDAGIKGSSSNFVNSVNVENLQGENWIPDPTLTNRSNLDEKIAAAYSALEYTINDKLSLKLGLRYEYTDSQLDTETEGKVVDKQYGIFFPSIFLSRKFNDDLNMNLSYSKRITRPTFNDLAPFVIFINPTTFISGNSALQPAISNSCKYDINYKSILLSFQYTDEQSSIASFQEHIDEETGRLVYTPTNLDYTKSLSITLGLPIKVNDWWKMQNNLIYIDQKIKGLYNEDTVTLALGNFQANTTQSFKITKTISNETTIYYYGPSLFGTAKYDAVAGVDIGFQKKFSDKWGTLKFSINDLFDSNKYSGGTDLPDQNIKTHNKFDFSNTTYVLTYSNSFGNSKLKSSRERQTGSEEERNRVNK
jgi:outer membrane receptor protein involved in Fe transport